MEKDKIGEGLTTEDINVIVSEKLKGAKPEGIAYVLTTAEGLEEVEIQVMGNVADGTISMTVRGAKAVGQNVYLFKKSDDSFEYVPSIGGSGGASRGRIYNGQYFAFN